MRKISIYKISCTVFVALLLCSNTLFAITPLEAFIQRVQRDIKFVPVNNLWLSDKQFDQTQLLTNVSKVQTFTLEFGQLAEFMAQKNRAIQVVLPKEDGGNFTIDLARYDYFTNDFKTQTLANGVTADYAYIPGLYYSGVVNGIPGSVAAFSFFNDEIYGMFSIPGVGNYVIVPNTMLPNGMEHNAHYIMYNDADLLHKELAPKCASDELPDYASLAEKITSAVPNNKVYDNCKEVTVFEVVPYGTYLRRASSVTSVNNFFTSLFNNQATLYRNDGFLISLKAIQTNTTSDVYDGISTGASTTSQTFLKQFGQTQLNNIGGANIAILMYSSSKSYACCGVNGMGGVAWLSSVCSGNVSGPQYYGPFAFCNVMASSISNFPNYSWDVEVTTHEMGHNVGSPHTHGCYWNPPARNTGIDGCYAVYPTAANPTGSMEGSCVIPTPAQPVGGGTIMSYCHLVATGINFSNGFGPQPRDTIKYKLSHVSCLPTYNPDSAYRKATRKLLANRECTDLTTNITYYWYDNNTASQSDDTLILMLKKNGNDIGNLDSTGFVVMDSTVAGYGSNLGVNTIFPTGIPGLQNYNYSMRHYWGITPITQPTTAVEVMFPYMTTDVNDLDGTFPGTIANSNIYMYKLNSNTVSPCPATGFTGATAGNFSIYSYGTTASASVWSSSNVGNIMLAHMLTTNLNGGGTGFVTTNVQSSSIAGVHDNKNEIYMYPNPAHNEWTIVIPKENTENMTLSLYAADGRLVQTQSLYNIANKVNISTLPTGVYFYRIVSSSNLYTGNIIKQ
ncbi:MAG: zinc-dependent metalloprotease [Bacteroidota bacterium]